MAITPFTILVVIALILTVVSLIDQRFPLIQIAVLLVCIALLVGGVR